MNMLRIATVEDDAHDLEALRTHLNRYEKENGTGRGRLHLAGKVGHDL